MPEEDKIGADLKKISADIKKIKIYIRWQKIFSTLTFVFLIIIPIMLGFIYLPPYVQQLLDFLLPNR